MLASLIDLGAHVMLRNFAHEELWPCLSCLPSLGTDVITSAVWDTNTSASFVELLRGPGGVVHVPCPPGSLKNAQFL